MSEVCSGFPEAAAETAASGTGYANEGGIDTRSACVRVLTTTAVEDFFKEMK